MSGSFLSHAWKQNVLDETGLEVLQDHFRFNAIAIFVTEAGKKSEVEVVDPGTPVTRDGHRLCHGEFLQHVSQRHSSQFQNQFICLFFTNGALGLQQKQTSQIIE